MAKTRVKEAQEAFKKFDLSATKSAHSKDAFEKDHHSQGEGEYVGDMVYGALDGIVTTFAIVAGSAGAGLGGGVIVVLGFANLLADGLSMAVGNYLSKNSEKSYYNAERKREEWEVENYPQGEREEIRQIYSRKGYSGKNLETLVELITSKKSVWIDTMMADELGLIPNQKDPIKAGLYTYAAFVAAGLIPLLIFVYSLFTPIESSIAFPIAFVLTFATIFAVGSLRSLVIAKHWVVAGFEMLLIGGATALISYAIGSVLGGLLL
ncbi:MAG TPA: VIT1/CCC1 transporter family protein [archaeon]|nr:VIT1/CCC1 transporter family protein [archaeon]